MARSLRLGVPKPRWLARVRRGARPPLRCSPGYPARGHSAHVRYLQATSARCGPGSRPRRGRRRPSDGRRAGGRPTSPTARSRRGSSGWLRRAEPTRGGEHLGAALGVEPVRGTGVATGDHDPHDPVGIRGDLAVVATGARGSRSRAARTTARSSRCPTARPARIQLDHHRLVVAEAHEPVAVDDVLHAAPGDVGYAEPVALLCVAHALLQVAEVEHRVLDLVRGALEHRGHPRRAQPRCRRALGVEPLDARTSRARPVPTRSSSRARARSPGPAPGGATPRPAPRRRAGSRTHRRAAARATTPRPRCRCWRRRSASSRPSVGARTPRRIPCGPRPGTCRRRRWWRAAPPDRRSDRPMRRWDRRCGERRVGGIAVAGGVGEPHAVWVARCRMPSARSRASAGKSSARMRSPSAARRSQNARHAAPDSTSDGSISGVRPRRVAVASTVIFPSTTTSPDAHGSCAPSLPV